MSAIMSIRLIDRKPIAVEQQTSRICALRMATCITA